MKSLGQECAATNVKSSGEKVEKLSKGASFFFTISLPKSG